MSTLKTMVVLAVLAMVGYGLYVGLNNGFQFQSGQTETPDWLKEEMHSGGGLPQVAPPQVTPQLNQESSAANSVSLRQSVSPGVPQAQYPSKPGTQPPVVHLQQPKAPIAGPGARPPANPSANQPVTVAPSPQTTASIVPGGNTNPSSDMPTSNAGTLAMPLTSDSANFSQPLLPAAIGTVPDSPTTNKLNISKDLAITTAMKSAKLQLQQGQLATAILTLSIWYEDPRLNESQQTELAQLLDEVAGSVIYSRKHLIEPAYTVRQGETLEQIAASYRVTVGLLIKINGIQNPQTLTPGDKLKVVRGPFNAVINGEKSELTLWLGGRYAGRFPLAMGPEFQAIVGPFVVQEKTRRHAGHSNLPWIRLAPGYGIAGNLAPADPQVGIAGMQQPNTAKQGATPGRIGVSVQDADDLFDILSQGSKVTIQR